MHKFLFLHLLIIPTAVEVEQGDERGPATSRVPPVGCE